MNRVGKMVPPKRFILKDISLSFFPGAKIGVLGTNGSGKSTLLKIMAGVDKEYEGEAIPMPGLNIGYLPQEPQLDPTQTVRESVEAGMGSIFKAKARLEEIYAAYGEENADFDKLATEQAEMEAIIASAGTDSEHQLEIAADALRLPPWDANIGVLSGGEKRRVALCRLLLSKPDMLLLDEPTNHLDAESVDWLEQFLQRYPGTVVAITHDRYFLDNAAEWILELDRGSGIPYKGNYSDWLTQKTARLEAEQKGEESRAKALKKELEWSRQNPKARQAKSKARLARFEELSDFEYQKRNETNEIFIPVAERLGNEVIEFVNVSKSFGDRVLIDNLSFKVPAGAIVGIIGPNGAGKSTLFNLISGRFEPTSGDVLLNGQRLNGKRPFEINRLGLSRSFQITNIFPKLSVFENLRCGVLWSLGYKYTFLKFLADLDDANQRASELMQMVNLEKKRDVLAMNLTYAEQRALEIGITIAGGASVILLDEPTAGMSKTETSRFIKLIKDVTVGKTLLTVEHDMGVVFGLADKIAVVVYGELLAYDTPEAVRANARVQEAYLGSSVADAQVGGH